MSYITVPIGCDILGLIHIAVEHRRDKRQPWKVDSTGIAYLTVTTNWFRSKRQEHMNRQWCGRRSTQLEPGDLRLPGELTLEPATQCSISAARMRIVIECKNLSTRRFLDHQPSNTRVRDQ